MSAKMISTAISAVIALSLTTTEAIADNKTTTMQMGNLDGTEKCYGIAKAHTNDCASAKHGCAGEAIADNDKKEWIAVPNGLCNKIYGGNLKEPTETKTSTA